MKPTPEFLGCQRLYRETQSLSAATQGVAAAAHCKLTNGLAKLHEEAALAVHRFMLACEVANDLAVEVDAEAARAARLAADTLPPPGEGGE